MTSEQADELAAQVAVQEALVAAFAAAGAADPALAAAVAELAAQAEEQLDRLQAAAPGQHRLGAPPSARRPGRPGGRAWLRAQVADGRDLARRRVPGPVRAPARRCSARSPRACAARTRRLA